MIKFENVNFKYDDKVNLLNNVNIEIDSGEHVALIGDNEYGVKKLFINMICGMEKGYEGNIFVDYLNIKNVDFSCDVSMGYIEKNPILIENCTVEENLNYVLYIRGDFEQEEVVENALKKFDLSNSKNLKVKTLSYFDRVKVAFSRMSMREIDYLLVDDIFSLLNEEELTSVIKILESMVNENKNLTIIMACDNQRVIEELKLKILKINNAEVTY